MKNLWTLALCLGSLLDATSAVVIPETLGPQPGKFKASPPQGVPIDRKNWAVTCSSQHPGNECSKAIDGNTKSFWHTPWGKTNPRPPHAIMVDMKVVQNINGVSQLPRQDSNIHNWIGRHDVFLSTDGKNWGSPVATGTWWADNTEKFANFEPQPARYVRLIAISEAHDNPWISIAELNVYAASSFNAPEPGLGRWGPTLDFPVVPVAGAVEPTSGRVVVWSAYRYDDFQHSTPRGGLTLSSVWDPATGIITQRNITITHHDMFCPGISMDGDGQIVVTGGNDAKKTSLYDSPSDTWITGPEMNIARGYQSSATTSDGRVFTIGGSWSGPKGGKNGEIYDSKLKKWTLLPEALVKPMLTADKEGIYRADNHGWLFGWKKGTVFQAGPSTAMNWYYTSGTNGDVKPAGKRQAGGKIDPDSMCGNAVMYDAVKGKILTFGGSPDYRYADSTANAHIITIGEPESTAQTALAGNGQGLHPRIFHTSVVLPDGTVFITGGQRHSEPFADSTPQLEPELYLPTSNTFIKQQSNSIIRAYHSISLLLPDGRVFNGGGGLCGTCTTNHFDAQIFTPNYLYDNNGNLAPRPRISSTSTKTAKVGSTITITTSGPIKQASLIRYGTATHTVNTDQRRIALTLANAGTNRYSFKIPNDPGIALPGYWMLFVLNSAGVPSVATTIKVTN
ncbi:galactose oxidase precursor [Ilyonectria robusta]|uniref:galactose oxidase precursor n=1 Tax=Ilyonectria robusta TaxID=1079257 RepID=UPI001E8E6FB5|nr:galactose oxidase precursor [Ilyonectria robusta]KAH8646426.1 galactose oxidase precursor [Ilyonectria robusta]